MARQEYAPDTTQTNYPSSCSVLRATTSRWSAKQYSYWCQSLRLALPPGAPHWRQCGRWPNGGFPQKSVNFVWSAFGPN